MPLENTSYTVRIRGSLGTSAFLCCVSDRSWVGRDADDRGPAIQLWEYYSALFVLCFRSSQLVLEEAWVLVLCSVFQIDRELEEMQMIEAQPSNYESGTESDKDAQESRVSRIGNLQHLVYHIEAKLWLASCKLWRKANYLGNSTA